MSFHDFGDIEAIIRVDEDRDDAQVLEDLLNPQSDRNLIRERSFHGSEAAMSDLSGIEGLGEAIDGSSIEDNFGTLNDSGLGGMDCQEIDFEPKNGGKSALVDPVESRNDYER